MLNLFRYVGIRHLQMKPIRTLLTTLGVSLGVALFIAIEIINQSTLSSFKENVEAVAGKAKLTISAGDAGFAEEKLDIIKKVPGVRSAVPMIESRAYFTDSEGNNDTLMVLGVDLLQEQSVRTYKTSDEQIIDDPLVFLNQPDSLIVTHGFADAHHFHQDSTFNLSTAHGTQKFTVRGLLSPEGPAKAFGGAIAIMDIDGARVTFGKEGKLDRVDIVPQEGKDVEEVARKIRDALGPGFRVERPESQSEEMERMVRSYQVMMTFFSTLALLVGLFLISNSISISVAERRKEIGTLRAMGATRAGILFLFLSEAVAMGAIGALAGAGIGRLLASALVKIVAGGLSSQFLTKIEITHLQFGAHTVYRAVAIGAGAALIAAGWPAFRAASIQPLEAMKRQDVGENASKAGLSRWFPLFGLISIAFVSISGILRWSHAFPQLETINQGLLIIGPALLGPAVVILFIRLFRPLAIPLGGTITRLAQDNLIRNPKRTGSNVMSLMIGLILVILVSAVNTSFKQTILLWLDRVLKQDLIVSSSGAIISYQTQPLHESIGRELGEIPGVKKGIHRSTYGLRFVHVNYGDKRIAIKANDEPEPEVEYSSMEVIDRPTKEAGYELYHSQDPVILVSDNFVMHYHKKRGDIVDLETPSGLIHFRIVGVITDYASDVGVFYMSRDLYKSIWKDPLVNAFGLQVAPGYTIDQVRQEIDRRFGKSKSLLVTSNLELKRQMIETVDMSFAGTRAIEVAALLVGLLGLLNTLMISVMERMREIGMLRAVGMSRGQVSKMILQEALFQGGFGAVTAVVFGGWLAYIWITYSLSFVLGWIIHFHFPWMAVGTTIITGLAIAAFAGFFPARKASQLEITEALEYE
jgi:putative ABC transport system permease protein